MTAIIPDMSNAVYHAAEGLSKSRLDDIRRSPAHYQWRLKNPMKQTRDMRIGTLYHMAVLEPEKFEQELAAPEEYATACGMRDATLRHPIAGNLLRQNGVCEQSVLWDDPSGLQLRCRPDRWLRDLGIVLDLKKTRDATMEGFVKSVVKFRYHVQDAMYSDGIEAATGERPNRFIFIACEDIAPHMVAVYVLPPHAVAAGGYRYREDIATYLECTATGEWPGYTPRMVELEIPKWANL